MAAGSWVILEAGAFAATALAVAAWLFGSQGVEFASWFAGVAGALVGIGTVLFAPSLATPSDPTRAGPARPADPAPPIPVAAVGSIRAAGEA